MLNKIFSNLKLKRILSLEVNSKDKIKIENFRKIKKFDVSKEYPRVIIDYNLPFNKFDLYKLAEDKHGSLQSKFISRYLNINGALVISFFIITFPISIYWNLLLLAVIIKTFPYLTKILKTDLNLVDKIFLCKNLKELVIELKTGVYYTVKIKNQSLADEGNFNELDTVRAFPIISNSYCFFIPYSMTIYDKEILSAVFRGYPLFIQEQENKHNKYIPAECSLKK